MLRLFSTRRLALSCASQQAGTLVLLRTVTVRAAQNKLQTQSLKGPNQVLRADTREKQTAKNVLRSRLPERPPGLNAATSKLVDLTKRRQFSEGLALFDATPKPDAVLYDSVLNLCAKGLLYDDARRIWTQMPEAWRSVVSCSTMIDLCRRLKKGNEAADLYAGMVAADVKPNIITHGSMIMVYSMMGQSSKAMELFESIKSTTLPNANIMSQQMVYLAAMSATARTGDYARTRLIFLAMTQENQIPPNQMHFNNFLTACADSNNRLPEVARTVFDSMPQWNLEARVEDYTILISCCQEDLPFCKSLLDQMKRVGLKPNGRTYQELLEAHIIAGDASGGQELLQRSTSLLDRGSRKVQRLLRDLQRLVS
ncbi:unnamed protein product [Polarella glacialis]|uniref:PROP1-like PPR domain-containing protein n=1 Tax=Polarella glacialis TaxID=89957 RepID=A0A813GCW0_POLGL|nr:unnamed protein product [Polarella glacialis]